MAPLWATLSYPHLLWHPWHLWDQEVGSNLDVGLMYISALCKMKNSQKIMFTDKSDNNSILPSILSTCLAMSEIKIALVSQL